MSRRRSTSSEVALRQVSIRANISMTTVSDAITGSQ